MKKLLLLSCVLIGVNANAYDQLNRSYDPSMTVRAQLDNDNPFLNLLPDLWYVDDDHGDTVATDLEVEIVPQNGVFQSGEKWSISLKSSLYTKDLTPEGEDLFPTPPQAFNEVETLSLTWDNI